MTFRRLIAAVACAVLTASGVWASTVLERTAEELYRTSDRIVVGGVTDVRASERDGSVWTDVQIAVDQTLLGDETANLTARFWGGTLDDGTFLRIDGMPTFEAGDRVLLFLDDGDGRASATIGLWQGAYTVTRRGFENARGETLTVSAGGQLVLGREDGDAASVIRALEDLRDNDVNGLDESAPVVGDEAREADAERGADRTRDEAGDTNPSPEDEAPSGAQAFVLSVAAKNGLGDNIEAAAEAWQDAGVDVGVEVNEEAPDRFEVGPDARFGAGVLSLSLRATSDDGRRVLLNPNGTRLRSTVVATELAFLAGVQPQPSGWLSGEVPSDAGSTPSEADASALRAALGRIPEDVNNDGRVDFYDLVQVASKVGQTGPNVLEDIDGSGTVDRDDIEQLKTRYEFSPVP